MTIAESRTLQNFSTFLEKAFASIHAQKNLLARTSIGEHVGFLR
jgi:hypothetical protein